MVSINFNGRVLWAGLTNNKKDKSDSVMEKLDGNFKLKDDSKVDSFETGGANRLAIKDNRGTVSGNGRTINWWYAPGAGFCIESTDGKISKIVKTEAMLKEHIFQYTGQRIK